MDAEAVVRDGLDGLDHIRVGAVGDIDQADVVVLAVAAPEEGLVGPGEPGRADERLVGEGGLAVVAVRHAALLLGDGAHERLAQAAVGGPEVEFADDHRLANGLVDAVHRIQIRFHAVAVEAVDVEILLRQGQHLGGGDLRAVADAEVEVVGVVALEGGLDRGEEGLVGLVDEGPAAGGLFNY